MAILTGEELVALRREIGEGVVPITWDKPAINNALQATEGVLEAQAFDATAFVSQTVANNARAQGVKADLDGGQVPVSLVPVVEDWLVDHPPSVTTRSVDAPAIAAWVTANRPAFAAAVSRMPVNQRAKVIRLIIKRRVQAVL